MAMSHTDPFIQEFVASLGLQNARSIEIRIAVGEAVIIKAEIQADRGRMEPVSASLTGNGCAEC